MTVSAGPIWDLGAWRRPPPLVADASCDVCVIGLGGAGLACIRELVSLGARVIGLDGVDVGAGAAGRNGGFLLAGIAAFHHRARETLGRERARDIYRETLREMDRMASETPLVVQRGGTLRISASGDEDRDIAFQREAMAEDRLPVEPYVGPEGHGLLFPRDGAFQPLQRARLLASLLRDEGVPLYAETLARRIETGIIETARGQVRADVIIACVDGGLHRLFPSLSTRVRPARLQMLATAPLAERRWNRPVYRRWGYDYWQQLPNGAIALGGGRDVGGEAEWTTEAVPSAPVQDALERFLRDELRVTAPITHRWAAIVGYHDHLLPICEEVQERVWAVGAYNGTGNVVGPLAGRVAAHRAWRGRVEFAESLTGP